MTSACRAQPSASVQSCPPRAISFDAIRASGPLREMAAARSSAPSSALPSSTTRLTRPIWAARSASIGSPVSSSSSAIACGSRRDSSSAPPAAATSDRLTSGTPNRADRDATTRSHASISSNPPASAQPSTAAIIGFRGGVSVIPHSPRPSKEGDSPRRNPLRSIPAENAPPAPVSTPTRSSESASSSSTASLMPVATRRLSAFFALGRLIVITSTLPRRSTITSSSSTSLTLYSFSFPAKQSQPPPNQIHHVERSVSSPNPSGSPRAAVCYLRQRHQ